MGRQERLRRRSEFERVYASGIRVAGRFVVLFGLPGGGNVCRLGITASRKVGSAIVRNRARRRIRELFRRQGVSSVFGGDLVVNVRAGCAEAPWNELEEDFAKCLAKLVARVAQRTL